MKFKLEYKFLSTLFLSLCLHLPVFAAAEGAGSSGGGDVEELRSYDSLTKEQLEQVLTVDSYFIKEIASNLLLYIDYSNLNAEEWPNVTSFAAAIQNAGIEKVRARILSSNFFVSETLNDFCPQHSEKSACTLNFVPGSTIFFNRPQLLAKKTSFAELVGIVIHEVSHWYLGEVDDQNFEIASFFNKAVVQNKHQGRVFNQVEGELLIKIGKMIFPFLGETNISVQLDNEHATNFCRAKGFKSYHHYETKLIKNVGKSRLYFYQNGILNYSTDKGASVLTKIICIH